MAELTEETARGTVRTSEDQPDLLRSEIEMALRDGVRMTLEQVIALWNFTDGLPGLRARLTWLEVGYQSFKPDGTLDDRGCGWIHILAKHIKEFASKGIDASEVFNRISEALLMKDPFMVTGAERNNLKLVFLETCQAVPFGIVVCLGSNGFLLTSYPRSLRQKCRDALQKQKRKRLASGSESTLTTKEAISNNQQTPALLVSQNFADSVMYKAEGNHQSFEYIDVHDLFHDPLAASLEDFGMDCYDYCHGEPPMKQYDLVFHDLKGLRLAIRAKEISGLETYYQFASMGGEIHSVREAVMASFAGHFLDATLKRHILLQPMRLHGTPSQSPARKKIRGRGASLSHSPTKREGAPPMDDLRPVPAVAQTALSF